MVGKLSRHASLNPRPAQIKAKNLHWVHEVRASARSKVSLFRFSMMFDDDIFCSILIFKCDD